MLLNGLGMDEKNRLRAALIDMVASSPEAGRLLDLSGRPTLPPKFPPATALRERARSLARMYAATIGTIDGVRLLDEKTVQRASVPRNEGLTAPPPLDKFPPLTPQRFGGLGYMLTRFANPMLGEGSFGHDGAGGRVGFAHPESGFAVAYLCNNMSWDPQKGPDPRWVPWLDALREMM